MDQLIDTRWRGLYADACRSHALTGWVVTRDPPEYPGRVVARLVAEAPTSYVLVADTLAEVHARLPAGLARARRQVAERDGPSARQGSQ